jgi:hypothetical protein
MIIRVRIRLLLSVRQQPEPTVPDPVLMDPAVELLADIDPDAMELMPAVAPEHKVAVAPGTEGEPTPPGVVRGIAMGGVSPTGGGVGLRPPLPSSVEPSGIGPPLSLNWEPVVVVVSGEAVPFEESGCNEAQPDIDMADPFAAMPPPSKVEVARMIVPVVPAALIAYPPEPGARMPQFGFGAGLNPPGLISVAPNGMPVPLAPPEPSGPRGEVAPIALGLIELCAWLGPQLSGIARIAAAITINRRIGASVVCLG